MPKLVYNIEAASPSMLSSLDRHCLARVPDGASNIDTSRSHLNQVLEGDSRGLMASMKALYGNGVKKPAKQSEKPYLRIVLSASPDYFRPDNPKEVGTWDEDRLAAWKEATMNQLREEHGGDLVFAELHLDEDTPHIHAVIAPTYLKKARVPGKQKRGETLEQFEERKELARSSNGVRTVGRASHPTLSKQGSFQKLRERMTVAVDHLGIEYGEDRAIDAPDGQSTREWVIQEAAKLRKERAALDELRRSLSEERRRLHRENEARQRSLSRSGELAENARRYLLEAAQEKEARSLARRDELEAEATELEQRVNQDQDFIDHAEQIADEQWEQANQALEAESRSEARRKAAEAEASKLIGEATGRAQEAADALLRDAREEAKEIRLKATPERFRKLEVENAKLRRMAQEWNAFLASIKRTLSAALGNHWGALRDRIDQDWARDPKNSQYKPEEPVASYSSGPSGP